MEIKRFGNIEGKTMMLLHGNLMCWQQFEDLIPLLERKFCVYAVSFDGFDGTGETTYTTARDQADKLAAYIEKELEGQLDGVKNYRIAVKKHGDDITFLRKIVRGGADESYGIEVAALAGVPNKVIKRAKEILSDILSGNMTVGDTKTYSKEQEDDQIGFCDIAANEIVEELKLIDATTYTPIEALNKLYELTEKAKQF